MVTVVGLEEATLVRLAVDLDVGLDDVLRAAGVKVDVGVNEVDDKLVGVFCCVRIDTLVAAATMITTRIIPTVNALPIRPLFVYVLCLF